MAQIDSKTQIILTQKIELYFKRFGSGGLVKQMLRYQKEKPLKYSASTVWKLARKKRSNELKDDTIKDLMASIGLPCDEKHYQETGIIKHLENEQ